MPGELLAGLNDQQIEAVRTLSGPLLIVAGPGAGKTRVLTHRIAALVAAGVPAYRILAVTFTNKAAREMRDRLEVLLGEEAVRPMWVATFHSACVRALRLHYEAAGLRRNFTIVDADDSKRLVKVAATDEGLLEGLTVAEAKDFVKMCAEEISRAKNDGRSIDQVAMSGPQGVLVAQVWAAYARKLHALSALDFDDILLRYAQLLERDPSVATWAHNRFSHVLVDEYQDTNRVQELITRHWAHSSNLCVVGDPDQSIYAFRGAAPAVMDSFDRTWPGAKVIVLSQNYRSTGSICAVSRSIIASNPAVHRADIHTVEPDGPPVLVHSASDSDSEATWVTARIKERGAPWSDHAVLLRTAALSRALENALRRASIPYRMIGGQSFYDRAEVKDVFAWLRLALNPSDELAFTRAISTPKRGLGTVTVNKVLTLAHDTGSSVLEAAVDLSQGSSKAALSMREFLEDVKVVQSAMEISVAACVQAVLGPVGLRAHTAAQAAKDGVDRLDNLDGVLDEARTFDTSDRIVDVEGRIVCQLPPVERVLAFVENAALVSQTQSEEEAGPAVQIMTIHAAKGKEFPHVYVVGVEENVLPHSRSLESEADIQEERRLAFVAVSRAQRTLCLTHCRMRFWFGDEQTNDPSRFLADLPSEHVLASSDAVAWAAGARLPKTRNPGVGISKAGRITAGTSRAPSPTRPLSVAHVSPPGKLTFDFKVDDFLDHPKFGTGRVSAVSGDYITVVFDGVERVFDATRAPLRKVSDTDS